MPEKNSTCDLSMCREIGKNCALFNLRKASRAITQVYEASMKSSGILPTQFTLLVATRAMQPVSMSKLAEALVMDRTTLTRNLKPMQREGWVKVAPGREDKRSREVSLTKTGLNQLERAVPLWQEAQLRVTQALGDSRLERMLQDLTAAVDVAVTS